MRILHGAAVLALGLSVACANKSDTAQTPSGGGAAGGGATTAAAPPAAGAQGGGTAARAGGAGAQAAAQVTPEQLEAAMKSIASTNGTLRMKLMNNQTKEAAQDAQQLATLFGQVERFFAQHNKADAVKLSQQGRQYATEAAGAAASGDQMKAQAAANNVGGTCKQCHGTYREGDAQTGFRIKAGVI